MRYERVLRVRAATLGKDHAAALSRLPYTCDLPPHEIVATFVYAVTSHHNSAPHFVSFSEPISNRVIEMFVSDFKNYT